MNYLDVADTIFRYSLKEKTSRDYLSLEEETNGIFEDDPEVFSSFFKDLSLSEHEEGEE